MHRKLTMLFAVAQALLAATQVAGQVVFHDDFAGNSLDPASWVSNVHEWGRTEFGRDPVVQDGLGRLDLETYSSLHPGRYFAGTDMESTQVFERGYGLEFESRLRLVPGIAPGIDVAFFTYVFNPATVTSDEIDFELLSNQIDGTADWVHLVAWNDWDFDYQNHYNDQIHMSLENLPLEGLDLTDFNTYVIRWLPDRVEWEVNGQTAWVNHTVVPDEPMRIIFGIGAPDSSWPTAFSPLLQQVSDPALNTRYSFEVDYVTVRAIPEPSSGWLFVIVLIVCLRAVLTKFHRGTLACLLVLAGALGWISPRAMAGEGGCPSNVQITGSPGNFELLVDGKRYYVHGVGFNLPVLREADEEVLLAKAAGFNSLRFWGQEQVDIEGLDLAHKYGMTVAPAWWLVPAKKDSNGGRDYEDQTANDQEVREIVAWVDELKSHPAVLMWSIGNEVYEASDQKEAFCRHLENICQAIHRTDPNHPVLYAAINELAVADMARWTPSLDVYGVNTYNSWSLIIPYQKQICETLKRPVIYTEFGPPLPQGQKPVVHANRHAQAYYQSWTKAIVPLRGYNIGGYFFQFRDASAQDTWFGIFDHHNRPKPIIYDAVQEALSESNDGP